MKMTVSFMFLFLLECYYLTRAFKDRSGKSFACAGVFHGMSVLVRAPTLLFPVFLLPAVLFAGMRKSMIKGFVLYVAVSSAIISVWTIRNYYALNDFLVVSAGRGSLLWYAVQEDTWNGDEIVVHDPLREYPELKDLPFTQRESLIAERVMKRALAEPGWYLRKMAQNLFRLWTLPAGKVMLARVSPGLAPLYQAAHYLLLAITFCGLFYISKSNFSCALPSFLYLLYASLMHSVVLAATRYRLPYDQLLLMFSAAGLVTFTAVLFPRGGSAVSPGAKLHREPRGSRVRECVMLSSEYYRYSRHISFASAISLRQRKKIFNLFMEEFKPDSNTKVLDVGDLRQRFPRSNFLRNTTLSEKRHMRGPRTAPTLKERANAGNLSGKPTSICLSLTRNSI